MLFLNIFSHLPNQSLELSIHKEQIKQHSITIVNFEREINLLRSSESYNLKKIDDLENKLVLDQSKIINSVQSSPKATETSDLDFSSLNKTIDLLRLFLILLLI
jgi:hypothetical protein